MRKSDFKIYTYYITYNGNGIETHPFRAKYIDDTKYQTLMILSL